MEFLLWHSGSKSDQHPLGCRFSSCPGSLGQGSSFAMNCGVGYRHSLNPALLWYRPEAVAPIQPLASWELPYATDAALKSPKIKTKNEKKKGK